jgi:hypothetical protein
MSDSRGGVNKVVGNLSGFARRRIELMFRDRGRAFRQLAGAFSAGSAGDALVTVALAGTLFFDVPTTEARDKVALYLVLTLAPYIIVSPLLPRLFGVIPNAYRFGLAATSGLRAVVALVLIWQVETFWLFPLAFVMLALSRMHGISKSALMPVTLTRPVALVSANALLSRIGVYSGAVAVPIGAAIVELVGPGAAFLPACVLFGFSAVLGAQVRVTTEASPGDAWEGPVGIAPAAVRISRFATAVVRLLNGYLLALLAFSFHQEDSGLLDFGTLLGAGGLGYVLASFLAPWLERRLREEPTVVAALAVEAAAAFIAGQAFGIVSGAALALAAGLAWGTAKFGFDGLLQQAMPAERRGPAFTRSETLFQIAWVVGALATTAIPMPTGLGLAIAGVIALTTQVVVVSGLLVSVREGR